MLTAASQLLMVGLGGNRLLRANFRLASLWRDSRGGCLYVTILHHVFDGDVGREAQGAVAEIHGVAESHHAAHDGPRHPFMLLGGTLERFAHGDHFARRFTAGDCPGVRRAHHHALQNGLPADKRFFPSFEGGEKLDGGEEPQVIF